MLYEILWQQNTHLAEACLHHPFVRGLADGTLYPEAFRRYVAQDAFFLNAFARAYALAAARSQDGETLISLCELLNGVLRELQLHAGYAKELKIELARVQPYRQVKAYTDFLLATALARRAGRDDRGHDSLHETLWLSRHRAGEDRYRG
jgi:thiaminase (transcriptional activator TenA)